MRDVHEIDGGVLMKGPSVLIRVYPRENAAQEDLKRLGAGLRYWLHTQSEQDGFPEVYGFGAALDALEAGELPDPEALVVLNAFRQPARGGDDSLEPEMRRVVDCMRSLTLGDYLERFPEGRRRYASFRVYGAVLRMRKLFDSLARCTHAPATAKVVFTWEVVKEIDRIGESSHVWEVAEV
jgi:hypothetical protein